MFKNAQAKLHWLLAVILLVGATGVAVPNRSYAIPLGDGIHEVPASNDFSFDSSGEINYPKGVAIDSEGNAYVVDSSNDRIQKFDSSGNYLTKWGTYGSDPGDLASPGGIAIDGDGNVYVADSGNNRIQIFDGAGHWIAQWGSYGSGDGQFDNPTAVAVDANGNVSVADAGNARIQQFDANGDYVTQWGSAGAGNGQFNEASGIAVDPLGNVYVADKLNNRIQAFSADGSFLRVWGSFGQGDGQFKFPNSIAIDSNGDVYVMDCNNRRVQKFNPNGVFMSQWGSYGNGDGQFSFPWGIAVDRDGYVYVADADANRIQKFDADGNYILKWGSRGSKYMSAKNIVTDNNGNVYVIDDGTNLVRKFDSSGNLVLTWGGTGDEEGSLNWPRGIDIDAEDHVYVLDGDSSQILKFDTAGHFVTAWGSEGDAAGQFDDPVDVAVDHDGFVYVADLGKGQILKFGTNGDYVTQWAMDVENPRDSEDYIRIEADAEGNVYTLNRAVGRIQKFDSAGVPVTEWGSQGSVTGELVYAGGISVDGRGNLYVADTENSRVQQFDSSGNYAAQWAFGVGGDYESKENAFPADIAVGAHGLIAVLLSDNVDHSRIGIYSRDNNANASRIAASTGALSPVFESGRLGPYTISVAESVYELTVTAVAADPKATVSVTIPSGSVTSSVYDVTTTAIVPLNSEALTPVQITVTALDGTTQTYELIAMREGFYTVSFNSMGGTSVIQQVVAANGYAAKPFDPTRDGYTFAGWYADESYETAFDFATAAITADKMLFAKWTSESGINEPPTSLPDDGNDGPPTSLPNSDNPASSANGRLTLQPNQAGEVSLSDEATISIPAGASERELSITIAKLENTQGIFLDSESLASAIFELTKSFPENFKTPITLSFVFDRSKLGGNRTAAVFYYDETLGRWVEVEGSRVNGNRIEAEVDHFTKFAVFAVDRNPQPEVSFDDIADHWAEMSIREAVSKGIVHGYVDGTFRPESAVTRAEFAVMLAKALIPKTPEAEINFKDADKIGAWARKAVAQAVQAGIIRGFADGSFRPNAAVTRSEMAVMIASALGLKNDEAAAVAFGDDPLIPSWARGSIGALRKLGLIEGNGKNEFNPLGQMTRAEAVTVLLNAMTNLADGTEGTE